MGQKILPDRKSSIFQETLDPKGFFICVSMGPKVLLEQILILLELKQMVTSGRSRIFPGGGAPTPKVGVLTYFFGQKLHENERIWTPGGSSLASPLDPPLVTVFVHTLKLNLLNCFNTVVKLNCFDTVVKLKIEI